MKKFIYGIIAFFVSLLILIVVAANSSFVIKKVVDMFAPDYNITYGDITGNVFTGVQIDGLKFDDMHVSSEIRFSWNPSKMLYSHIAIDEVLIDDVDVETVKAFIASLPSGDDNSTSSAFPFVVNVGRVHISLTPFTEYGVHVEKSVLDAEDIIYETDGIEVGDLHLLIDSNITNIRLSASLNEGTVKAHSLKIHNIDSEALVSLFSSPDENTTLPDESDEASEPLNPLIPKIVQVEALNATLKRRKYLDVSIDSLMLKANEVRVDIGKIVEDQRGAIAIGKTHIALESDVGKLNVLGSWDGDTVTLEDVSAMQIDTLALKSMFALESNETNATSDMNASMTEAAQYETPIPGEDEPSVFMPKKVIVKQIRTDILPALYKPVHIHHFALDGRDLVVDVAKLLIEKGELNLNATTNLSNIKEHSSIRNNHLDGHIVLTPNQPLFELYKLPFRKKAIGDIGVDFTASKEKLTLDMTAKAKHILVMKKEVNATDENSSENNTTKPFNVDINLLRIHGSYLIDEKRADANIELNVTSPYAKESTLEGRFRMNGDAMAYEGMLRSGEIVGVNADLLTPLRDLKVHFKGDEKQLKTVIDSQGLTGYFNVPDFTQGGALHLETKAPIEVAEMVTLPEELNATKVNVVVDVPLNFKEFVPIKGKASIRSNVANVNADLLYGKRTRLKVTTVVPEDSLLKHFDNKIQWGAISPLNLDVQLGEKDIKATIKSSKISAKMNMLPFDGKVTGDIRLAGMTTTLDGTLPGNIVIHSDVKSFRDLMRTVKSFYAIEGLPEMDGKLNLSLIVSENKEVYLSVLSPEIIYYADRKTTHTIGDVSMILKKSGGNLELSSYHLIYNDMTFYSSKPSVVDVNETLITIPQLWLNNQLKITGKLDTKTFKGKIDANAPTFHFVHEWVDLDAKVDVETVFDGNRTDMNGKITLLEGNIHYDLNTKTFPSDSDIIVVQDMKKESNSTFMENLTMMIKVDSKKPIVYKEGPVNVKAMVDVGIHKALYSDPLIIGSIDIVDGSSYNFQGKVFKLEHSHIYLTGDPTKPMLDLTVKYKALKHIITIVVTGTPTMPNIIFSSVPSLSQEQILSLLLFDSEEAANTGDANDMMKMMGGAMAKAALNDLGVKIDHLVIGEGNSVEVGKKIGDKTTVIYINGEIPKMEVKYEYSPTVEVIVGASEQSESIDVVYRKDFNMRDDDIVIKRR